MIDKGLLKEVKARLDSRISPAAIKQEFTAKGFSINDINAAIYSITQKKPRKTKKLLFIMLVIVGLIIVFSLLYVLLKPAPVPYYQDDPKTWVEDKSGGIKEINVDKVTKGEGFMDEMGQQYRKGDIATVFDYEGFYQGNYFKTEYTDESGKVLMRITPDMKPNDGIIEGFIIEKIEDDGNIYAYIFVDEDWKKAIPDTNIIWGKDYQNARQFDFSKAQAEGIYMDTIQDDKLRFENDFRFASGGVVIGNAKSSDVSQRKTGSLTLIRVS